jgi:hypothetical protein
MPPSSSSDQSEYDLVNFSSDDTPEFGRLDCISKMLGALALGQTTACGRILCIDLDTGDF